jgi:hypothetical protein
MKLPNSLLRFVALVAAGILVAAGFGRLSPHTVNDTPSYLEYPFDSLRNAMLSIRTPGYPIFLRLVDSTVGLTFVPLIQVLLHVLATWALGEELVRRGMRGAAAFTAATCTLVGCTFLDHVHTVSTDAPAASLGVLTAVFLMRAVGMGRSRDWVACCLFAMVCIFFRPAYLFLVPWLACAGWMLSRLETRQSRPETDRRTASSQQRKLRRKGWMASGVLLLVLVGWMGLRKAMVGEFALVPFGHQNLSAVLVQTVRPETLKKLSGEGGELAKRVADDLQANGFELPEADGQLRATLKIERQWGRINYGVILPAARALEEVNDSSDAIWRVRVHQRIGAMNRAILATSPEGYLRWCLLAIRRAVWGTAANLAMHPIFLTGILAGGAYFVWQLIVGRRPHPIVFEAAWCSFAVVGLTYFVFNVGFVMLTSPPIGRFADAAAIFLPGLLASLLVARQPQRSGEALWMTRPEGGSE